MLHQPPQSGCFLLWSKDCTYAGDLLGSGSLSIDDPKSNWGVRGGVKKAAHNILDKHFYRVTSYRFIGMFDCPRATVHQGQQARVSDREWAEVHNSQWTSLRDSQWTGLLLLDTFHVYLNFTPNLSGLCHV